MTTNNPFDFGSEIDGIKIAIIIVYVQLQKWAKVSRFRTRRSLKNCMLLLIIGVRLSEQDRRDGTIHLQKKNEGRKIKKTWFFYIGFLVTCS